MQMQRRTEQAEQSREDERTKHEVVGWLSSRKCGQKREGRRLMGASGKSGLDWRPKGGVVVTGLLLW